MQATMLVCDDVRAEWNGKYMLIGTYVTDMTISFEPFYVPQLQFFLIFECTLQERPKNLRLEITLPQQNPVHWNVPVPKELPPPPEGRTRFHVRHPFGIFNACLMAGHIMGRVITDKGELELRGPWITKIQASGPMAIAATSPPES